MQCLTRMAISRPWRQSCRRVTPLIAVTRDLRQKRIFARAQRQVTAPRGRGTYRTDERVTGISTLGRCGSRRGDWGA